jgi:hypothetical protein
VAEQEPIRQLVARVAREVLDYHRELIERDIAERFEEEYSQAVFQHVSVLANAADAIRKATSQAEILESLLNGVASQVERCGLFVMRGNGAQGWQSRGIEPQDAFRRCTLDCTRGQAARAISGRAALVSSPSEVQPAMAGQIDSKPNAYAVLVPVVIRDRVVALVYGEHSQEPALGPLEMLVHSAEMWLELQSYRKSAPPERPAVPQPASIAPPAVQPASPPPPVFMPALQHRAAASVSQTVPVAAPVPAVPASEPASMHVESSVAPLPMQEPPAPVASYEAAPGIPPQLQEKARRFAKLLVEEIKLYNQTKVAEGRNSHDLYDRLKVDIEKSREAYGKRFGALVREPDFFSLELIRILAMGDASLLGANFPS